MRGSPVSTLSIFYPVAASVSLIQSTSQTFDKVTISCNILHNKKKCTSYFFLQSYNSYINATLQIKVSLFRFVLTSFYERVLSSRIRTNGVRSDSLYRVGICLTLLGLGLIKINDVSANFNNPKPSLILNN